MSFHQSNRASTQPGRGVRAYVPPANPATWVTLGAGAVLGLILGLVIGWGVAPVQWTDAWPSDLSREARAQYLAAVAEAYVYYGDAEAAEIARNRLFDLNADLEAQIADAVDFFAATRPYNYNATITNLGLLAQRLDVAPPTPAESIAPGVGDTVRAWVNWTLMVFAALVLAIGGILLVNRIQKRRAEQAALADEPGGFDAEESDEGPRSGVPVAASRPFIGASTAVRQSEPTARKTAYGESPGDDYGFAEEDHDDDSAYRPSRPVATVEDYALRDEAFDDDSAYGDEEFMDDDACGVSGRGYTDAAYVDDDVAFDDDPAEERGRSAEAGHGELPETELLPTDGRRAVDAGLVDPFEVEEQAEVEEEALPAVQTPRKRSRRGNKAERLLSTYSVHYQAGLPESNKSYIQAYPIVDEGTGITIGECGMAVNTINGIVDSDPDAVVAMEVWLVDKKKELAFESEYRVLISEYAYDRGLESKITRDRPSDPAPIIPQGGRTTFDIKCPNLTLHCEVVEAVYSKSGPRKGVFESLRIEMSVLVRD